MFDILVGRDVIEHPLRFEEEENEMTNKGEFPMIPEFVPSFVRELIENGWSHNRSRRRSFEYMMKVMKENNFEFAEGVEICEVVEFVNSVEASYF
jgi:hypothetical protein